MVGGEFNETEEKTTRGRSTERMKFLRRGNRRSRGCGGLGRRWSPRREEVKVRELVRRSLGDADEKILKLS